MKKILNDGLIPFDIDGNMVIYANDYKKNDYEYTPYIPSGMLDKYMSSQFYIRTETKVYSHIADTKYDKHIFRYDMRKPVFYAELKPVDIVKYRSAVLVELHDREKHKYYSRIQEFIASFEHNDLSMFGDYLCGMWRCEVKYGFYSLTHMRIGEDA